MINGLITLDGFIAEVHEGEANKVVNGQVTDEKVALKVLKIRDAQTQLQIHLVFLPEQFAEFTAHITGSRIVRPPGDLKSFFTRNGRIKQ